MADEAQSILGPVQADNSVKADAWQAFKDSVNEREFGSRLQGMNLPDNVKADLWEAKRRAGATLPPVPFAEPTMTDAGRAWAAGQPPAMPRPDPNLVFAQEQARERLKNVAPNVSPQDAIAQEQRLNQYNPGGQMAAAAALPGIAHGIITAPLATAAGLGRGILGAAGGSTLGGIGGREIGSMFGAPQTGAQIGATLGGIAGGVAGARGVKVPTGGRLSFLERLFAAEEPEAAATYVPATKSPGPYRGPASVPKSPKVAPAAPEPFPGATPTNVPVGTAQLPPAQSTAVPEAKRLEFVSRFNVPKEPVNVTEPGSNPQDLISRMKKLVIPGEEPSPADLKRAGDLTQAPGEMLKSLAKYGDKLAQNEINRRLKMGLIKGWR